MGECWYLPYPFGEAHALVTLIMDLPPLHNALAVWSHPTPRQSAPYAPWTIP